MYLLTDIFWVLFLGGWMFPILTEGRHMATKGVMMGSSGIIMAVEGEPGQAQVVTGVQKVKTRTSLSLQTRLNI